MKEYIIKRFEFYYNLGIDNFNLDLSTGTAFGYSYNSHENFWSAI